METKTKLSPARLREDCAINPEDLTSSMMSQAGLFAYYASLSAKAQEDYENYKMKRDVVEAKVGNRIRDEATASGDKLTEKKIESLVRLDEGFMKAQLMANRKRAEAELAKSALEALKQKRDMLVQIGVSIREEMKGEMRIKAVEAGSAALESSKQAALDMVGKKTA